MSSVSPGRLRPGSLISSWKRPDSLMDTQRLILFVIFSFSALFLWEAWQRLPGPRELAPGADKVELKLQATASNGDKVIQTQIYHRGSYVIDVAYDITNVGTAPVAPFAYFQLTRDTKSQSVQSSMAPAA